MTLPKRFICASRDFADFDHAVPAPYLRKSFFLTEVPADATITITGLGFYRLYVNGKEITKGILAPYISNPDHVVYYDRYAVDGLLREGENVIGILLGNGMQNCFGGFIWEFDQARWRGAPMTALRFSWTGKDGKLTSFESDESFRVHSSALLFDELRCGEYYDARLAISGWSEPDFDDSAWAPALPATSPRGELRLCEAEPIAKECERKPVSIKEVDGGYLYDFGINDAGVCRLTVNGKLGQMITTIYGEWLHDGTLDQGNINFGDRGDKRSLQVQQNRYTCKGDGVESYTPAFAYYGFQYVLVKGITAEQATPELLTYLVMHSNLQERGSFSCSDEVANTLQTLTRRSSLSNFYYFPTDCPHREKNGWTGDAALSAEHMLLNLAPERSYREWLRNVAAAQDARGALPGIVPTGDWGFAWGNGPAWDCVLTYLPYYMYKYRGDQEVVEENATPIFRYLDYLTTRLDKRGLLAIGLGDWCPPSRGSSGYKSPLAFTDSVISMDIAKKAAFLFGELGRTRQQAFAENLADSLRQAIRRHLIDFSTMTAAGACQTSQAMALYYDIFEEGEKPAAFGRLLELIDEQEGHMDTGILGSRVLFHVLAAFGKAELAYEMITRPDYPSYGNWVAQGATTLWEAFWKEGSKPWSLNHHFFGDISGWFIQWLGGIRLNVRGNDCNELLLTPQFVEKLDHVKAKHLAPAGEIAVCWKREGESVRLMVTVPEGMTGLIRMPKNWLLPRELAEIPLQSGEYLCKPAGRQPV